MNYPLDATKPYTGQVCHVTQIVTTKTGNTYAPDWAFPDRWRQVRFTKLTNAYFYGPGRNKPKGKEIPLIDNPLKVTI